MSAGLTSRITTSNPLFASQWAMPEPITPAASSTPPTLRMGGAFEADLGNHGSRVRFFAASLRKKA